MPARLLHFGVGRESIDGVPSSRGGSITELSPARPARDCEPRLTDYEHERASYVVSVPERFNAVEAIVDTWAAEDPDAPAVLSLDAVGEVVQVDTAADSRRGLEADGAGPAGARGRQGRPRVRDASAHTRSGTRPCSGACGSARSRCPVPNLLTPKDIAYRVDRGRATAAITDEAGAAKVDQAGPSLSVRLCVGGAPRGWEDFDAACEVAADGEVPADVTHRDDPLLLYFTSGTVSYPKMVQHAHSYALGHVGTARFWHDLRPGDLHWTVTDTGWAQGRLGRRCSVSCTSARASCRWRSGRPDADTIFGILARHGITSFCAPPTLYRLLVQGDFGSHDLSRPASLHERGRAAEPRGDPGLARGDRRTDRLRRLRPDRDHLPGGQLPRDAGTARARWGGRCRAGM